MGEGGDRQLCWNPGQEPWVLEGSDLCKDLEITQLRAIQCLRVCVGGGAGGAERPSAV